MNSMAFTPESSSSTMNHRFNSNYSNSGNHNNYNNYNNYNAGGGGGGGYNGGQSGGAYNGYDTHHSNHYDNLRKKDDDGGMAKQNASNLQKAYSNHHNPNMNSNILLWSCFVIASMLVFLLASGGSFSFLITLGGMTRMFGFGILLTKIWSKGPEGVSTNTLLLYATVFACRLSSIVRHEGYLPYDKSGDWVYHVIEAMSLVFTLMALFACNQDIVSPRGKPVKTSNNGPAEGLMLAIPVLVIAVFIHPNLNRDFLSDVAWTYSMYLESVALIPQLNMFQQKKKQAVEWLTAHFVAALGFGRVIELSFWIFCYDDLASHTGSKLPGYVAVLAQFLQLLLLLNFFRHYYLAVKNKAPLILPSICETPANMV